MYPNPPHKPVNEYLKTRILTASPEELRLMLLDGALKYGAQAKEGLERKDFEAAFNGFTACRNIVTELLTTIRDTPDPKLAEQVRALYSYMFKLLVEAGFEKDAQKAQTVIELLQYERETWVLLMEKVAGERAANAGAVKGLSVAG
jgi:flagellar secretion chaperone FliS